MQGTRLWRQQILFYSIHRAECCSTRERSWFFFSSSKAQLPNGRKAGQRKKRDLWAGGPRVREVRCSLFLLTFLFVDLHIASRQRKKWIPACPRTGRTRCWEAKEKRPRLSVWTGGPTEFFHVFFSLSFCLDLELFPPTSFLLSRKEVPARPKGWRNLKQTNYSNNQPQQRAFQSLKTPPTARCMSFLRGQIS